MKFLVKWFINIIALLVVIHVIAGVSIDNMQTVFVAALLFSIISSLLSFMLTPKINIRFGSFRPTGGSRLNIDKDDVIDVEGKVE